MSDFQLPQNYRDMDDHDLLLCNVLLMRQVVDKLDSLNGRVRSLETWRSALAGGVTVLVFSVGLFVPWVLSRIP